MVARSILAAVFLAWIAFATVDSGGFDEATYAMEYYTDIDGLAARTAEEACHYDRLIAGKFSIGSPQSPATIEASGERDIQMCISTFTPRSPEWRWAAYVLIPPILGIFILLALLYMARRVDARRLNTKTKRAIIAATPVFFVVAVWMLILDTDWFSSFSDIQLATIIFVVASIAMPITALSGILNWIAGDNRK